MNPPKQNDNRSITSLLSQMNIGFLILDESGSIIKINNSCANFLGLSDNVVGCSIIELLGAHELVDLIRSKSVSGASPKEISGPKSSGRKFLVNTSLDAKSNELTIIMMDTTRVHKLESMRRDFITNISHELRTPLTVIRANAESLVDGVLKDQKAAKNFSEAILKNSEKMTTLLSDILNLATIESGEYSLDIEESDADKLISDIVNGYYENFKAISFHLNLKGSKKVLIDAHAFKQVVTNLIDNAIRYGSPEKGIEIYISSRNLESQVRYEIEDRGTGIPSDMRERVFERFFRLQSDKSKSNMGVGLGLAIVKNLINLMGGSVGNEAAFPKGTTFWFTLNRSS